MPQPFAQAQSSTSFENFLARYLDRDLLRFTTAGSVDDGKSTLIGRLLYDSKSVYQDQVQAIQKGRLNRSTGPMDFSLLTDGLRAEREQGITIDVAYRYFTTPRRKFIIADTPGHEQYTRNMATGASTANAAVVLVDARKGILPQSRRHATIAALLGIPHIIAAINKMDLVGYSEDVFRRLEADLEELAQQIALPAAHRVPISIRCIPISALEGDNVVTRSTKTPWYGGPSLLEYLEEIPVAKEDGASPFRFPVQYVIRPDDSFRGFAGQIISGSVKPGDRVVALPSRQKTRVRSIVTFDGNLPHAGTGSSITLQLEDELDLTRGDVLVSEQELPHTSRRFVANVVWLHDTPLDLRRRWIFRLASDELRVHARKIHSRLDVNNMERQPATQLGLNDIGTVEFEATRDLSFDLYTENRNSGSFILIDPLTNATVGAGMITQSIHKAAQSVDGLYSSHTPAKVAVSDVFRPALPVAVSERSHRFGHHPAAVWLGTWHSLAAPLERALFEAGYQAIVLDDAHGVGEWNENLIRGLYSAGMIVLYTTSGISEEKKRRLYSAIQMDQVLDADALDHSGDESKVVSLVVQWIEELRIGDRKGTQ
ncbi:MAG TPA: sulfate adenylyltransferase subunit CysN [Acidobacteriaceae bacterium]|nr:sulfate adenylyltransferase subunit CysN [Acidobacteriaceae bacterium]